MLEKNLDLGVQLKGNENSDSLAMYTLVPFSTLPTKKCDFVLASAKTDKVPKSISTQHLVKK